LNWGGLVFEGERLFTKQQAADIMAIDERTIDRYLSSHGDELAGSGYRVLKGKSLKNIRLAYVDDMSVVDISPKVPSLGEFTFRALEANLHKHDQPQAMCENVIEPVFGPSKRTYNRDSA
jgi:hypothetical protein